MHSVQNLSLPFSFSPDQNWNGNAGSWSTFTIRVGTPPQDFSVLPSTTGHQPWIPVPAGCTSSDPPDCGAHRGAHPYHGAPSNGFLSSQSSTWKENGIFDLAIETSLGLSGNGDYGYDTVGLELENSGGLTLANQVIAGIATKDFYVGQLGLGPKPSNFTTFSDPIPGYLASLVTSNLIPSFSYGYTAGAKYRLDGVLGSLILGGYDTSRFVSNNISIPFASDDSRILTVGVQSITVLGSLQVQPLAEGEYFLIDSSVPDLWLPELACQVFEETFGLTYDNTTDLYLINESTHSRLLQMNPTINLKIGVQNFDGPTVDIDMPYKAFDLQATSPIYPNATNYFPIRRGANSTQYTLGRTFLQEAYIVVDYERLNFSVSQAIFRDPNPETIVTIQSTNHTSSNVTSRHGGLSHGMIAGAVIGPIAFVSILTVIAFLLLRKRGAARRNIPPSRSELEEPKAQDRICSESPKDLMPELDPKAEVARNPQELGLPALLVLPKPQYELQDTSAIGELPSPALN